ncbi:MAG: aldo/keto reductase [Limnochordia bacterium]
MKFRALGNTGMQVSEIGLGAWQIGGPVRGYFEKLGWIAHGWGSVDDAASIRMMHTLADVGVNFVDTAAVYGAGHSEEVVGQAVKGKRQQWIIETKGGEGFHQDGVNWRDFSRAKLLSEIDGSLSRLGTDYVDVYLLHSPSDAIFCQGECLEALAEIKQSGKARFVGASVSGSQVPFCVQTGIMDVLQVHVNILSPASTAENLALAGDAGIGIVARGAFGSGFFTGSIDATTAFSENDRRSWQSEQSKIRSATVARAFQFLEIPGRSLTQSYLRYLLALKGVSTVIVGSMNLQHMLENAATPDTPLLTQHELTRIDEVRSVL